VCLRVGVVLVLVDLGWKLVGGEEGGRFEERCPGSDRAAVVGQRMAKGVVSTNSWR
jgi:hypothetical protein